MAHHRGPRQRRIGCFAGARLDQPAADRRRRLQADFQIEGAHRGRDVLASRWIGAPARQVSGDRPQISCAPRLCDLSADDLP